MHTPHTENSHLLQHEDPASAHLLLDCFFAVGVEGALDDGGGFCELWSFDFGLTLFSNGILLLELNNRSDVSARDLPARAHALDSLNLEEHLRDLPLLEFSSLNFFDGDFIQHTVLLVDLL